MDQGTVGKGSCDLGGTAHTCLWGRGVLGLTGHHRVHPCKAAAIDCGRAPPLAAPSKIAATIARRGVPVAFYGACLPPFVPIPSFHAVPSLRLPGNAAVPRLCGECPSSPPCRPPWGDERACRPRLPSQPRFGVSGLAVARQRRLSRHGRVCTPRGVPCPPWPSSTKSSTPRRGTQPPRDGSCTPSSPP